MLAWPCMVCRPRALRFIDLLGYRDVRLDAGVEEPSAAADKNGECKEAESGAAHEPADGAHLCCGAEFIECRGCDCWACGGLPLCGRGGRRRRSTHGYTSIFDAICNAIYDPGDVSPMTAARHFCRLMVFLWALLPHLSRHWITGSGAYRCGIRVNFVLKNATPVNDTAATRGIIRAC